MNCAYCYNHLHRMIFNIRVHSEKSNIEFYKAAKPQQPSYRNHTISFFLFNDNLWQIITFQSGFVIPN